MLLPDAEIISVNHRHERYYRHTGGKTPYLCLIFNDAHYDDEMTVSNSSAKDRHAKTPHLREYDTHDGRDDDLQRYS